MTLKEQILTRLETLPQDQLPSLLEYIEYLAFRAQHIYQPDKMMPTRTKQASNQTDESTLPSVLDVLASAKGQQVFKTADAVEAYLEQERNAWA